MDTLARAPSASELVADTVESVWTHDVGKSASDALALGDSVVLAVAADRKVTLLRRDNGQRVWVRRLKGVGTAGPLFTLTQVYSASGDREGHLHAHEFWTGKVRWTKTIGSVHRPIALRQSQVFAATTAGFVFALSAADGEVNWQRYMHKPVRSGVTVLDSRLFVATDDSLFLLSVEDGSVVHATASRGPVIQPAAVSGSLLVLVSPEAFIAAYDANTLEERWWHFVGDPILGGVAIARDTAFLATVDGDLWRVPLANPDGAVVQSLDRPMRMTPTPVRNGVLVGTVGGEVLFLGGRALEPVWTRTVDGPLEFSPVVDNGTIFVYDGRGTIHAWREPPDRAETPGDEEG
jgi:outer membrane protein assembly factor BamB